MEEEITQINENIQINSEKKPDDDTTFNKLKELQKLLKKESAMKELFVRMKDETKKNIEKQFLEVLQKKMEVLNILQKIREQTEIKKTNEKNDKNKTKDKNKEKDKAKEQNKSLLKEYCLVENNYNYLSDLNKFITNILKYLWEEPKILAELLSKANKDDVKFYLAPLICNNFYQNILSSNNIEDPLIYVIYLLLKKEVDKIESIEKIDSFLERSNCSYLLGQLIEHYDVKEFFKITLQDSLEDLGKTDFYFEFDKLKKWIKRTKATVDKSIFEQDYLKQKNVDTTGKRKNVDSNAPGKNKETMDFSTAPTLSKVDLPGIDDEEKEKIKNSINYKIFTTRYFTSVELKTLEENIKNNNGNENLKNYYEYLLLNAKGDEKAYSQTSLKDLDKQLNDPKGPDAMTVKFFYMENCLKVMKFITKLFENLLANYRIIPYSLKCICKIIYLLISNKFPNSTIIERYLFITKFFFKTIIFPILSKPDLNALINDYLISNKTLSNMKIINFVLLKLTSFQLFREKEEIQEEGENANFFKGNFTTFNHFFLEVIPEVLQTYKSLIDINLPKFIKGLIDKSIDENEYCFDFFNENPNDISFYQNILLNAKEFNALFTNLLMHYEELCAPNKDIENTPTKYSEIKKRTEGNKKKILLAVEKLKTPESCDLLAKIVNQIEYSVIKKEIKKEGFFGKKKILEEKKEKVQYFHISQLLFNEKSKQMFSLEQKNFYYHIKEIKEKDRKTEEMIMKNNIIKCKNFISTILYNYRILNKDDFISGSTSNTMDILNELTHFMKSSNFLIDGTIPSEWYLVSLIQYLKKLPEEYKKNDYEKLYDELNEELHESIKACNFEYMSMFLDEMKLGNRNKVYFEKMKQIYMDIELNMKTNAIIENDEFNINILFRPKAQVPEFSIFKESTKDKQIAFLDTVNLAQSFSGIECKTIEDFAKQFPDLNKYVDDVVDERIKIFQYQTNLDFPNQMMKFFQIISTHLKNKIKNENELNIINDKIYDYVMSKIYEKIYPKGNIIQDVNILQKTCQVHWVEPEHIIKGENVYDFEFVLPDINNYFTRIRLERSPRKKILCLNNIFSAINKLLKFSKGDGAYGVDDQIPLLLYCFIKSRPWRIYTDSHFMRLYIGNKKNKAEDNYLSQLLTICDLIKQAKYSSFNNISEIDFHKNSQISYNENTDYMSVFFDVEVDNQ